MMMVCMFHISRAIARGSSILIIIVHAFSRVCLCERDVYVEFFVFVGGGNVVL